MDNTDQSGTAHTLQALDKLKADNATHKAKLHLLQKQCELLDQLMIEHEWKCQVHVMDDQIAQIRRQLGAVNRMIGQG